MLWMPRWGWVVIAIFLIVFDLVIYGVWGTTSLVSWRPGTPLIDVPVIVFVCGALALRRT
jgi:hypothetical protein